MTQKKRSEKTRNIRLFVERGRILYLGPVNDVDVHNHHAIQAAISAATPFEINIGDETIHTQAFLIDSDRLHRMDSHGECVAIFLIEPESRDADRLRRGILRDRVRHVIEPHMAYPIIDALSALTRDRAGCAEARHCFEQLIETWGGASEILPERDERIDKVLAYIQALPQKRVSLPDLAAKAFLSESRFIHLFTQQVGIPPRRYLLWARVLDAVRAAIRTDSLTAAAYEAGFADSAHLSRTFKRNFGQAPSFLVSGTKNSQFVQAFLSPD